MSASRRTGLVVGVVVVALAASTVACSGAFGAVTRLRVGSIGGLSEPLGVAVDQGSGDVYVADAGNHRVVKFAPGGELLLGFGGDVGGPGVDVCSLSCGVGTEGSAAGEFVRPSVVAVDGSGGPSSGDVYVADTGDNRVSKFDSSGALVSSWGTGGQLDGSNTTAGSFGALAGIAVDGAGTLEVLNTSHVLFRFSESGSFVEEMALGERGTLQAGLAVDAVGDLFKVNGDGSVEKFAATGNDLGQVSEGAEQGAPAANAIAVDPLSGDLYVATTQALDHYAFNGAGEVIEPGGGTCALAALGGCRPSDSVALSFSGTGIGVSSESGISYVSDAAAGEVVELGPLVKLPTVTIEAATEVQPASATVNGAVNPEGIALTDCRFNYVDQAHYKPEAIDPYAEGRTAPCVPSAETIPADNETHSVSAHIEGLIPGETYHFRLQASNANGTSFGVDETLATPPPPAIDEARVKEMTATSAVLVAKINPEGATTNYRFEYGTNTEYGTTVPGKEPIEPEGGGDQLVEQAIAGLTADTLYHWRVVATNASGTTTSVDHTFIYDTAGRGLPDNRAYEMVTPPDKNGALIGDTSTVLGKAVDISADGTRLVGWSIQCFADAESCNAEDGNEIGSPYEFKRTPRGWISTALAPPASQLSFSAPWSESAQTGMALFTAPTPPDQENDFYVRQPNDVFAHVGPNTPPQFGAAPPNGGSAGDNPEADTTDFSHIVWQTEVTSLKTQWPFDETVAGGETVYEYVGVENPQPMLVGVTGTKGSTSLVSSCLTVLGDGGPRRASANGAMSSDGHTVVFTAMPGPGGTSCPGSGENSELSVVAATIYARVDGELPDAHTVNISQPSPSECGAGGKPNEVACREAENRPKDARFAGASADGSKIFFMDTQQLTDTATQDGESSDTAMNCVATHGPNGCNLYEYDFSGPAGRHILDVSQASAPQVQGVLAVAPDGSRIYFVAKGVLSAEGNAFGGTAQSGANNLYVFERNAAHPSGTVRFIADLPDRDSEEWSAAAGAPGHPANVSSDGRFLLFLSSARLTADDTSLSGAEQVFRYDAANGQLIRVSKGDRGFNDGGNRSTATPCGLSRCSEDAMIVQGRDQWRSDPSMSDDGSRLFFQSPVALAPGALDDVQIGSAEGLPVFAQNVYEWENGRVFLISDGRDTTTNMGPETLCARTVSATSRGGAPSSVCLLGTDASGNDVFFSTADRLAGQDVDSELDYYDARVCTSAEPCLSGSESGGTVCVEDACQGGPGAQPGVPVAASVGFVGRKTGGGPGASVRVLRRVVRGSRFILVIQVSGAGRLSVQGARVHGLSRSVGGAGAYRFVMTLRPKARRLLRRRGLLRVPLRVVFVPSGGGAVSAGVVLNVRRGGR